LPGSEAPSGHDVGQGDHPQIFPPSGWSPQAPAMLIERCDKIAM
jgi:hypothetical protein